MKKILFATNVFLLGIVFFFACNNEKPAKEEKVNQDVTTSEPYKRKVIKKPGKGNRPNIRVEKNYDSSHLGLISYNTAIEMSRLYREDVAKSRVGESDVMDASSIWFSLDMMKDFISKIEACSPKRGAKPKYGVRIYYALYPDSLNAFTSLRNLSPVVAGKHTVFLVPTYMDSAAGLNADFNVNYLGRDSSHPVHYANVPAYAMQTFSILAYNNPYIWADRNKINTMRIMNHGGLSPPPDSLGSFPTPEE